MLDHRYDRAPSRRQGTVEAPHVAIYADSWMQNPRSTGAAFSSRTKSGSSLATFTDYSFDYRAAIPLVVATLLLQA
jgi:hypothetical protein